MPKKTARKKPAASVADGGLLSVGEALWLPGEAMTMPAPKETYAQKMQRLLEERRTKKVPGKKTSLKRAKKKAGKKTSAKRQSVRKSVGKKSPKKHAAHKAAKQKGGKKA